MPLAYGWDSLNHAATGQFTLKYGQILVSTLAFQRDLVYCEICLFGQFCLKCLITMYVLRHKSKIAFTERPSVLSLQNSLDRLIWSVSDQL